MYRVCEQYLTTYPADKELLWEVQNVGGPFQRSSIANKIKTMTFKAEDSSSSFIRESMETEVVTEEETIQGTVTTSMQITEEVVIINKHIKAAEGIEDTPVSTRTRSVEFRRKRLRDETVEVSEESLPEKINRVEETKAEVEAPAAELAADEPVEEKEDEQGPNDEEGEETEAPQEEARGEEGALEAEPLKNMESEPMDSNVITNEETEEGAGSQELGEPAAVQENDIHMEDIEMENEAQDTVHAVPEEVAKHSAEQEVSAEGECPPTEAAVPLEEAHSPEPAAIPSNITAGEEEVNEEAQNPEAEQTQAQNKSGPPGKDVQEEAVEEETEETQAPMDFCQNAVLLVGLKEVSYQLSEKGGNEQIVEVERKLQKEGSEDKVEIILERLKWRKEVRDQEEEEVNADEAPLENKAVLQRKTEEVIAMPTRRSKRLSKGVLVDDSDKATAKRKAKAEKKADEADASRRALSAKTTTSRATPKPEEVEEDGEEDRVDEQREEPVVTEEQGAKVDENKNIEGEERVEEREEEAEENAGEKNEVEEENVEDKEDDG
ncbi:hypothetical protein SKAU_G00011570 [Synaphobranchus kaupii]|uniref:Uncharacterized protein n=1 Tax=Synaphobranchus kaupii TaxID=118154 RepID=A0A9Q1GBB5_SYNKA|nr:hypothetical protein SKAU_G00011570 [Synaphobranchus kaupii]